MLVYSLCSEQVFTRRESHQPGCLHTICREACSGCPVMPTTHNHSLCVLEQVFWPRRRSCAGVTADMSRSKCILLGGKRKAKLDWCSGYLWSDAGGHGKKRSHGRWRVALALRQLAKGYHSSRHQAITCLLAPETRDRSCPAFKTSEAMKEPSLVTRKESP